MTNNTLGMILTDSTYLYKQALSCNDCGDTCDFSFYPMCDMYKVIVKLSENIISDQNNVLVKRSANYSLGAKSGYVSAFVNKVVLERSHTHSCTVYGCFHSTTTELSSCDKEQLACKAVDIYHLVLYRKSLLTAFLLERFYCSIG